MDKNTILSNSVVLLRSVLKHGTLPDRSEYTMAAAPDRRRYHGDSHSAKMMHKEMEFRRREQQVMSLTRAGRWSLVMALKGASQP